MAEKELKKHLYVLVLCGGGGTRLWPRSKQKTPKQFLPDLFGPKTIFAQTIDRALGLVSPERIFVVTNNDYADEVLKQGRIISPRNVIAEPQAKNTAMAMGVGAAYIKKIDPAAIILNFASDQVIGNQEMFAKQMMLAAKAAADNQVIVTVGLRPSYPHTGLGYIEAGKNFGEVYRVASFKEKPDLITAKKFLAASNYYWNANLYVWSVTAIWQAFEKLAPKIFNLLKKIYLSLGTAIEQRVLSDAYNQAENISIDYAVSEKANNLLLVPATFDWSDVGDWKVVYDLKNKDKDGNVIENFGRSGWNIAVGTKNCLIESSERLIVTIGVENLIVVETNDAVVIAAKDKAQEVKGVVEELKKRGKVEYL
ncbi:MAG: sugar phosphate nucleotidyltransferase [Candidatus Shapirobacteria bacterium]